MAGPAGLPGPQGLIQKGEKGLPGLICKPGRAGIPGTPGQKGNLLYRIGIAPFIARH